MPQLQIIEGNRAELEERLVELIFLPGENSGEVKELIERLKPKGQLHLLPPPFHGLDE